MKYDTLTTAIKRLQNNSQRYAALITTEEKDCYNAVFIYLI